MDILRGAAVALMAFDHFRTMFRTNLFSSLTDLGTTTVALFLSRWVTHFCAPVFVFLAGTGAFLAGVRGRSRSRVAWLLLTRGLWLVALELVLTGHLAYFDWGLRTYSAGVIWAIGWSMVVLAGLVYLPLRWIVAPGLLLIAAHNLLDGVRPEDLGPLGGLWTVLHVEGEVALPGGAVLNVHYPLVPWVGAMAAGYGFGALLSLGAAERRHWCLALGIGSVVLFVVLRLANAYGDPLPWSHQKSLAFTALSFLNCTKYPPSLLYLLMALGPALAVFPLLERGQRGLTRFLAAFGRVPLFFYVVHLLLLTVAFRLHFYLRYGTSGSGLTPQTLPDGYGYSLPVVCLITLAVLLVLYPACRWYAGVKRRSSSPWLTYL
ncbi:MAG: heparan-alpha-glucosaminide N-acetyltransferase domain-containing protein [Candidatus Latescibacterota bacterium]